MTIKAMIMTRVRTSLRRGIEGTMSGQIQTQIRWFFSAAIRSGPPRTEIKQTTCHSEQPHDNGNESQRKEKKKSSLLHENIYTLPNILTFSRLLSSPLIGYLVLHDHHLSALSLLIAAGITDLVDGFIARKYNLQTIVGSVIDPMADKALMTILTVTLAIKGLMPVWLAGIILVRDAGLGIAAVWYRWISLPEPKTMRRYWDFSLPSAEVRPTEISKVNTVLQLVLITVTTAYPVFPISYDILKGMQYLVAGTTIWSGWSYVGSKTAVRILSRDRTNNLASTKGKKGDGEDGVEK